MLLSNLILITIFILLIVYREAVWNGIVFFFALLFDIIALIIRFIGTILVLPIALFAMFISLFDRN